MTQVHMRKNLLRFAILPSSLKWKTVVGATLLILFAVLMLVKYSPGLLGGYAVRQAQSGRYVAAVATIKVVAGLSGGAESYSLLGDVLLEAQRYREAAQAYQQALLRDPAYPGARYKRARMLFSSGDYELAVAEATKALEENPEYIRARYIRGLAYSYLSRWEEAMHDFSKLVEMSPDWPWTRIDLSWSYLALGRYQEAEQVLEETVAQFPNHAWALNNLGLALMNQEKFTEAANVFQKALNAVDNISVDQFLVAYPLLKPHQFQDGQHQLKQGMLFNVAVLHERQGEIQQARQLYTEVLGMYDQNPNIESIKGVTASSLRQHLSKLPQ